MSQQASSVLCVIPARGGSKDLPGKNLMHLDGESLSFSLEENPSDACLQRVWHNN
jgi:CMP-N-acetylneuraminic acid synthetase